MLSCQGWGSKYACVKQQSFLAFVAQHKVQLTLKEQVGFFGTKSYKISSVLWWLILLASAGDKTWEHKSFACWSHITCLYSLRQQVSQSQNRNPSLISHFPLRDNNLMKQSLWVGATVVEHSVRSKHAFVWLRVIEMIIWQAPDLLIRPALHEDKHI